MSISLLSLQPNWSHLFLPFLSVLSSPYCHVTHFPNWSQTDLLKDATLITILFSLQPFTGIPLLSGWRPKPEVGLKLLCDLVQITTPVSSDSSLAFESQYHNYIEKFFFFLFTLLAWILYSLMHYHTLCTTHLKSGRQGLKKMKHKTQKQKDESMFSGNIDGSLNVVILLLLYFLEFKNISKIIHKVIYFGEVFESEVKAHWWMGLGNLHKLTDIDRMTFYSSK